MSKYLAIFKLSWQKSMEYRLDFFGKLILGLISFSVMVIIFKTVFSQVSFIAGYSFPMMFTYLAMTKVLHFVTRGNTAKRIADEIKDGKISVFLLKPVGYLRIWLGIFLADRSFEILVRSLLLVVLLIIVPSLFSFPNIGVLMLFFISVIMALSYNYLINTIVAAIGFWVVDIRLFTTAFNLATGFLAGELVPIDIFPLYLKKIAEILPFRFLLFFPIKIYQEKISGTALWIEFIQAFLWLFVLIIISRILWRKGLKNYEAIGQ